MKRSRIFVGLLLLLLVVLSGCNFGPNVQKGTITGTVKVVNTGEAIPGATVTLKGTTTSATTNADGAFQIANVIYGNVELIVNATGYIAKTVAVTVNAATVTVNVELEKTPLEITDAKQFVKDFRTSFYEMGSIALAETGVVSQFQDEVQQFFTDIAPYLGPLGNGLMHLQILSYQPGRYIMEEDEYGDPIYTLIEAGNIDDPQWVWKVIDPTAKIAVELYSPNVDECLTESEDGDSVTIDFTDTTFGYKITSTENANAVYTGQIKVGKDNVKSYQLTDGETNLTIKVPSGKTVTANFVVDPKVATVGSITIDASFDLTEADTNLTFALDGTITTPVFTYTGNLTVNMDGIGTVINPEELSPQPFTVNGSGTLKNDFFEATGNFSVKIIVIMLTDEYDTEVTVYLPVRGGLEGTYKSANTEYHGYIQVELLNGSTFNFSESWIPKIKATLHGEVKNLENTYLLNLEADFTDNQNVIITTRMAATNKYDLAGSFNYNLDNGLTKASMVNENGLYIEFDVTSTVPENIGGIYQKQGGPQFATIAVVLEDEENPYVSVNFTDSTSEIIPLNPLVYLMPQN